MRKVAEDCEKQSGPVLEHIGTVNVSRDMDVMRQALGDKKLNYLGFSYGTRLGAVYAAQFPKKVGRMTLDGVDTLTEHVAAQSLATAEGRQTALDNFVTWCTGNAGCVFGTDSRSARTAWSRSSSRLDECRSSPGRPEFTGQDVVGVLSQALYSRQAWPALSQALGALLADGDPRALIRMSGGLPGGVLPGGAAGDLSGDECPADNMTAALMGVNCADDPDRPDAAHLEKEIGRLQKEFDEASPVFGKSMTDAGPAVLRPAGRDPLHPGRRTGREDAEAAAGRHAGRPGHAVPVDGGDRAPARTAGHRPGQQGRRATPVTSAPSACRRRWTGSCCTGRCRRREFLRGRGDGPGWCGVVRSRFRCLGVRRQVRLSIAFSSGVPGGAW